MSWLSFLDKNAGSKTSTSTKPGTQKRKATRKGRRQPRHLAIILDGNGRWATQKGLPRTAGHAKGVESVRSLIEGCLELGIEALSLYTFSTMNWNRPEEEVNGLMRLLQQYLNSEGPHLASKGVRVRFMGAREKLPKSVLSALDQAESRDVDNQKLLLNLAVNYGGQEELVHAVRQLALQVQQGKMKPEGINETNLEANLFSNGLPPVDLLIRTAGERRLSNFMLWHSAYAELLFMDVLWPDFERSHLDLALADFASRRRTFGGLIDRNAHKQA